MGLSHSPKIVTNGLVFAIDIGNYKSYKGPVVTNLLDQITNTNSSGAGKSITSGTQEVFIPQLGTSTVKFSSVQNNYAVSGDCCPSPFAFSSGFAVTPSTLYTYSIVYKVESGYTNPNYMYRYEYTSNGGTYVTEGGLHNDSNRIHLGDGWYWAWGTFTTQATTNWIAYSAAFYYRYSTSADRLYIAKVMLVQGNYTQLHPKYWPDVNTARANTTNLLNLTNTNIITTSLTYANDGKFTFNGSSNWIELPTSSLFDSQTITMESWNNPTTTSQNGFLFEKGQVNTQYSNFYNSDGTFYFRTIGLSSQDLTFTSSSFITANKWNHVVCTVGNGTKVVYVNGNIVAQATGVTGTMPTGQTNQYIGKYGSGANEYTFNGSIAVSKVYNRALTASEVQQNFIALRGRYGI